MNNSVSASASNACLAACRAVNSTASSTTNAAAVRNDRWRILVGDDAHVLDRMVRESPESAYEPDFLTALRGQGHLAPLTR